MTSNIMDCLSVENYHKSNVFEINNSPNAFVNKKTCFTRVKYMSSDDRITVKFQSHNCDQERIWSGRLGL